MNASGTAQDSAQRWLAVECDVARKAHARATFTDCAARYILTDCLGSQLCGGLRLAQTGQERAVTDSRGHVSGNRAYHAMGVSASARRTTAQHRQLVRRVAPSRVVAVSNARPDTSYVTAGAISSLCT